MQKILFFDDEPSITGYIVKNLQENFGLREDKIITYVTTVGDLLDQIYNIDVTYDLFVLDIITPELSGELKNRFTRQEVDELNYGLSTGLVIAKKIRQMAHYADAPILYLTARPIPPIPDSEKEYTAYIRKPVSPDEISKKMKELLKIK